VIRHSMGSQWSCLRSSVDVGKEDREYFFALHCHHMFANKINGDEILEVVSSEAF